MVDRVAIVDEARSWCGTPYISRARIKGAGVDCAMFPYLVYHLFGLVPEIPIERYSLDWWAHATTERYLLNIERYLRRLVEGAAYAVLPGAQPGNLLLTRAAGSKVYNHAGIVVRWPRLVHAINPRVIEVDASVDPLWAAQHVVIFDPWRKL